MATASQAKQILKSLEQDVIEITKAVGELKEAGKRIDDAEKQTSQHSRESAEKEK